jgi:sugar transferase (PEP-CTERM/EpsH1 system associated)
MIEPPRPNILYLTHRVPFPPDKGERIRTYNVLRWLSSRAAVHLASVADEPVPSSTLAALQPYCAEIAIVPLGGAMRRLRALGSLARGGTATEGAFSAPALRAILRRWASRVSFRATLSSASSMVPYLRLPELVGIPAVVDLIDVDSQKWLDYAASGAGPKRWFHRIEGRRLRRLEHELASWTRAITLVSEAEAELYRRSVGDGPVRAILQGVDLEAFRPGSNGEGLDCVFVGALDYRPNVEGIDWFSHEVWPHLHRLHPGSQLHLVGRRPSRCVRRLEQIPGIVLVGQVADVRPYVARAAVAIAPLRIARGVQTKVLEALAMAKATVVSPQALEGLHTKPGVDLLVASTPQEWINAIDRLLDEPELRTQIGNQGRCFVESHHHWQLCLEPLESLLGLGTDPDSEAESQVNLPAGIPNHVTPGETTETCPVAVQGAEREPQ